MKSVAIAVLSVLCLTMFVALCVLYPDNVRLSYELRQAEADIRVNADTLAVLGERITILRDAMRIETLASYYGENHRGRLTASGTRFDPDEMTAASPWLPFGSVWLVTRIDTGASVRVVITDRGPHPRLGRGLDLSTAAARELGMLKAGVVAVRMEPGL